MINVTRLSRAGSGSKNAEARNRQSIITILAMNMFNVLVMLSSIAHTLLTLSKSRLIDVIKTEYSLSEYNVNHFCPLSQAAFNAICFAVVSSSFKKFVRCTVFRYPRSSVTTVSS